MAPAWRIGGRGRLERHGKSEGPDDLEAQGWTRLEDGWWGRGPIEGGGWRIVRPPDGGSDDLASWLAQCWGELTADMLQLYGVDVADRALMRSRPWTWFLALVNGAVQVRSRLLWGRIGEDGRSKVITAMAQGGNVAPWR